MNDNTKLSIGVIGAGAWGTALAQTFAEGGKDVVIWARETDVVSAINEQHENTPFLPGHKLHANLKATNDIKAAAAKDIIVLVTPAQFLRASIQSIREELQTGKPVVICAKGVELSTGMLMSEVIEQEVPGANISILSGPTFAAEIVAGKPAAATIACADAKAGADLAEALETDTFRPYASTDVIGAQLGGALKNVMAIACGIIHGRGLGESARAALVTRGAVEISRLGEAMGAQRETLMGMCGIGDMMLTCSSMQSRNFSLGAALGEGQSLEDIMAQRSSVTEGVHTANAALELAKKYKVDMPIVQGMSSILSDNMDISAVIAGLMDRPLKFETAGEIIDEPIEDTIEEAIGS